jgi:hypothetical protein
MGRWPSGGGGARGCDGCIDGGWSRRSWSAYSTLIAFVFRSALVRARPTGGGAIVVAVGIGARGSSVPRLQLSPMFAGE